MRRHFKTGERVAVIDDNLEGTVIAIKHDSIRIRTSDGFEIDFKPEELITREGLSELITETKIRKKDQPSPKLAKKKHKPQLMEVDLHAHVLFPSTKGMRKHDILTAQLDVARKKMEEAIRKKVQRVIFIHGIGKGKLRTVLLQLLRKYPVQTNEAPYREYGQGALEVKIFQNYKESGSRTH